MAIFVLLLAVAAGVWMRSRRAPVDQHNVNDDWDVSAEPGRVPAGSAS